MGQPGEIHCVTVGNPKEIRKRRKGEAHIFCLSNTSGAWPTRMIGVIILYLGKYLRTFNAIFIFPFAFGSGTILLRIGPIR
jgi:hypothetical protein